jgi:transposase
MQFTELTDKQWNMLEQHIPKPAHTGRPRSNDRMITNGIIYVLISGCRWSEMPRKYGDDSTANLRLRKWQEFGVWKKILSCAIKSAHKSGKLNLQRISVDSSSIPNKKGETLQDMTVLRE